MPALRGVLRIAGGILTVALVGVIVGALVVAVASRQTPDGPAAFRGRAALTVLSGSMTPTFRTGDVILDRIVTPAGAAALPVGTIITFRSGLTSAGRPMLITHRIVGTATVQGAATSQRAYVTKGDANNSPDQALVAPAQIVGVYILRVPYLGYVSAFVRRPLGFALIVVLPAVYLIGGEFLRLWRAMDAEERQKRAAAGSTDA